MADSLLDNYNPLYDIHLRQYFALPHMQKHLQKMGLLESTLNLNGDEVYARHHAMMDMMLKNREAQLVKMAELRKKLDAAEKVECCRRIRTGQSPESYRQGKPSRSLSRNRAGQNHSSGGRQRRFSNSYEDRDFVQRIEERNADPVDYNTRDPYKRLSANAKRFNYLHKLDDNTLIAYKDNLKKQLQRLERFREISFGPHSVARQAPPPQASWFFRRRSLPSLTASAPGNTLREPLRSVLNMRGRKATTGNKLNASHDSRTSCPPTTRKRKDSNTRLPPINPQKNRVPTKPPAPVSLQQTTTRLPPAAKKPAPTRGRPSNKRQTTTTTTTTITSVSKSPTPIATTNTTTTLPALPSVTGHGIFTGAAAAATVAAIGTAAINMDDLIDNEPKAPSPPSSPVLETQKTFDRSFPTEELLPADILDKLADESEELEVAHNAPVDHSHGDYEDSDSEPEYAEEDREEETFVRQEIRQDAATPVSPIEPLAIHVQHEETHVSPPVSDMTQESQGSPKELNYQSSPAAPSLPSPGESPQPERITRSPPTLVFTEQSTEEAPQSPPLSVHSPDEARQSPIHSTTQVVEHFDTHDATPQSPVLSVHEGHGLEDEPRSPVQSIHDSEHSEAHVARSPSIHSEHQEVPPSPIVTQHFEESDVLAPRSPSVHSEHQDAPEYREPSPDASTQSVKGLDAAIDAPAGPVESEAGVRVARSVEDQPSVAFDRSPSIEQEIPHSPAVSMHSSHASEHPEVVGLSSPVPSEKEHHVEHHEDQNEDAEIPVAFEKGQDIQQSPSPPNEHSEEAPAARSPSIHSEHQEVPQSPIVTQHFEESDVLAARSPSVNSEHQEEKPSSPIASEHHHLPSDIHSEHEEAPQSPPHSEEPRDFAARSPSIHSEHQEGPLSPAASHHSSHASEHHDVSAVRSPSVHSEHQEAPLSPAASHHSSHASEHHEVPSEVLATRSSPVHSEHHEVPHSPVGSMHSSHVAEHHDHPSENIAARSPSVHSEHHEVAHSPVGSIHSSHASEHHPAEILAARSPSVQSEHHEVPHSPVGSIHSSHALEHHDRPAEIIAARSLSIHSEHQETIHSPVGSVHASEHHEHPAVAAARSPSVHSDHQEGLQSPVASIHSSHGAEQESFGRQMSDHQDEQSSLSPSAPSVHEEDPAAHIPSIQHEESRGLRLASPTANELYNPSEGNMDSPVSSNGGSPRQVIADRIDLEAYHNSPTKESTSPVTVNPTEVHITPDQVADQLHSPTNHFEDTIDKSADEEASHLIQEALTEAPAIIDMVNTYEEKEKFSPRDDYELKYDADSESATQNNPMMTSIYQPGSDHEEDQEDQEDKVRVVEQPEVVTKEWDEGDEHIKESKTHTVYSDGNTEMSFDQKVTIITDNDEPSAKDDNISTDSLVIHDDHQASDYQMTQSIYQPQEYEDKEWDEGKKHVHEVTHSSDFTDESGKHYHETSVTTTTTVIKSSDDMKNNNDDDQEDGSDIDDKDKIIEEEEEHGPNGNSIREGSTTEGHPKSGILVDDGDETNISSL